MFFPMWQPMWQDLGSTSPNMIWDIWVRPLSYASLCTAGWYAMQGFFMCSTCVFFSTHHPATLQGMTILTSWPCRTNHPCFYEITRVASSDGRTMSNATSAWNDVFYVNRKPQIDSTVIDHCPCSKIVLNCRYLSFARNIHIMIPLNIPL